MTLELMARTFKQDLKIISMIGAFSTLGCAKGATGSYKQENQGGNGGTYQEVGLAGFGGNNGSGLGGSDDECTANYSTVCNNGDVYWQDNCGNLGELLHDCSEKQICSENQSSAECAYDCNATTLTTSCMEQNCSFYDSFDYGACKWEALAGVPYVSNEKLHLQGNSLAGVDDTISLPSNCNGDFIAQYKAELLDSAQGSLKISHRNEDPNFSGLTIVHFPYGYPANENDNVAIDCMGQIAVAGNFDLHSQNSLVVHKTGNQLDLYVDNNFAASVVCNESNMPTPVYKLNISAGSAVLPQSMKIDDVTLYCQNSSN